MSRTLAAGLRVAADDELRLARTLNFQPLLRATTAIVAVAALADDALQAQPAGSIEKRRALRLDMIRVTHAAAFEFSGSQQLGKCAFAFQQRDLPQILSIEVKQIEYLVDEPIGAGAAQSLLQSTKAARAIACKSHDLSIQNRLAIRR